MTNLTETRIEIEIAGDDLPANVTITQSSEDEIRESVRAVIARERDQALDMVTALQIKARMTVDTGKRLTLDEFAAQTGWSDELAQLRSE